MAQCATRAAAHPRKSKERLIGRVCPLLLRSALSRFALGRDSYNDNAAGQVHGSAPEIRVNMCCMHAAFALASLQHNDDLQASCVKVCKGRPIGHATPPFCTALKPLGARAAVPHCNVQLHKATASRTFIMLLFYWYYDICSCNTCHWIYFAACCLLRWTSNSRLVKLGCV